MYVKTDVHFDTGGNVIMKSQFPVSALKLSERQIDGSRQQEGSAT